MRISTRTSVTSTRSLDAATKSKGTRQRALLSPEPQSAGKAAAQKSDKPATSNAVTVRAKAVRQKPDVTPATHPQWFTSTGQLKWKVAPPDVVVTLNDTGVGDWIEKWQSPKTQKWVHNYTAAFVAERAVQKFEKNERFATKLVKLREAVTQDLKTDGKQRVVATAVALIDRAYFRVGNEKSEQNGAYGTTTLLKKHVQVDGARVTFDFVGKTQVRQHKVLNDKALATQLSRLLAGKSDDDHVFTHAGKDIDASDVNAYLERFGATAKMFRTYHATRLAREALLQQRDASPGDREDVVSAMFEKVAEQLGHTPAVCRQAYVDPQIIEDFLAGKLR